jgi:replication factor A1
MSPEEKNAPITETDRASKDKEMNRNHAKEEVLRLSKDLGISLEEAERAVYGKVISQSHVELTLVQDITELKEGMKGIVLKARVITSYTNKKRTGEGDYHFGILGDAKSTVKFSAWSDFDITPGMAILIKDANVRIYKGELELVLGERTNISLINDLEDLFPVNESDMPQTISELSSTTNRIDIECRVIELNEDTVKVNDKDRRIFRGVLADHSGRIDITCWDELPLEVGRCYRILGGRVKDFRGIMKLNLDAGTMVKGIGDDRLPSLEDLRAPRDHRLVEMVEGRFSGQVRLRGTVIDVRSGSGIFRKCEDCGRKLVRSQCVVHGKRKGEEDMAIRAVFDDGTSTCMLRGNRTLVESLLERPMEAISEEVKDNMDPEIIIEELRERLVGKAWTFTGDPILDEYGITVSVCQMEEGMDNEMLKDEISALMEVIA